MLKNTIYLGISVLIFFTGVITYGIILNIREITLDEALNKSGIKELNNIYIIVDKKQYKLLLYSDSLLIKSYKSVFGKNSGRNSINIYDNITPEGKYKICRIDSSSKYHLFLQLNYPNKDDLARALKFGSIAEKDYKRFLDNIDANDCMPCEIELINNIGIHGIGEYNFIFKNLPFAFNWTNGSIAVSNENIEEISSVIKIGTSVEIKY